MGRTDGGGGGSHGGGDGRHGGGAGRPEAKPSFTHFQGSWSRMPEYSESMDTLEDPHPPFWRDREEIINSGSGPRNEDVQEYSGLLLAGEYLVTEGDLRSPPGLHDLPKRHGILKGFKRFDARFFSVTPEQRHSQSKRTYVTVVHAKGNTDKEQGITFPLGERQPVLLEEVYREANIDPNTLSYVESYGTGTKVGNPQEAYASTQTFSQKRTTPLLIGYVKSNMGHAEPPSGACSIAKLTLSMWRGYIPPNLHFDEPNEYIEGLKDGLLKVVTVKTEFPGGLIGENFSAMPPIDKPTFPKATVYWGRTKEAVENVFNGVKELIDDFYLRELFASQANLAPKDTPYRGVLLINHDNDAEPRVDIQKFPITETLPVWFVYSGMCSQWPGMAHKLMRIPIFDNSLRESSKSLEEFGLDVYKMLCISDSAQYKNNPINCMLAITVIQSVLTDTLRELGVVPEGSVGHSTGEMGCSYADGALTRAQTMKLDYNRGNTVMNSNGQDSVTISGDTQKVQKFCAHQQKEEIVAKTVDSSGIPSHSPAMMQVKDEMLNALRSVMLYPKPSSSKWVSTSVPEDKWEEDMALYCSADYHVKNSCSPVPFYEALQKIPPSAITIEIAPHSLLEAILRRSLHKTSMNMKAEDELESCHWKRSQDWPVVDGPLADYLSCH